ncbi:PPE domain-containing protein [Mycobacterium simiae]|uniref:PPE domain-containing protein n=1 Tax=Mycobacterium simiae TaxID=1784 RepID=A0A5B1BY31_MYCSI|nr:PPE domain-containing protein [Mycobacterium simiae]
MFSARSARMWLGAGSEPMLAAASAWDALAAELSAMATLFSSAINGLAQASWQGWRRLP